jgi:hypothetical protein
VDIPAYVMVQSDGRSLGDAAVARINVHAEHVRFARPEAPSGPGCWTTFLTCPDCQMRRMSQGQNLWDKNRRWLYATLRWDDGAKRVRENGAYGPCLGPTRF